MDGGKMSLSQTIIYGIVFSFAKFKKNVAIRSSNLAQHQIFYLLRNCKIIHSRERNWYLWF